jgi:tetratricopeptide (TPR) repeat protein
MITTELFDDAGQAEAVGRWDRAAEFYESRLTSDLAANERAEMLVHLTRCLREDDKYDEAEERITQARGLVNEDTDPRVCGLIRLEEGRLQEHHGDHRGARRKYRKALQLLKPFRGDYFDATLTSAALERSLGELCSAEALLRNVDRADLSSGQLADYLGALGAVQLASGNYRLAEETLNEALELDENESTEYGAAETRLLLAQTYLGQGDRARARRLIEEVRDDVEAVDDTATLSDIYSLLGQLYEESDDNVNAVRWYQQGLNLDITAQDVLGQGRAYRRLARTFRKRGDLRRSLDYLEAARPLCRDNEAEKAELLTEEGDLALDQGDYATAEDKFRQAKQLIEDDRDERRTAIASRHLARALHEKGDLLRAEKLLREALPVLRDRGDLRQVDDLLDDLGEVLLDQDRYAEALAALNESYTLDQQMGAIASEGRTLLLRGRVLLQLGERDKAAKSIRTALDIYIQVGDQVGESNARFQLGEWHEREGQLDQAIEHFRAGQAIDSRHDDRLGLGRTARALASIYRRKGDLRRAAELLAEARRELQHTEDPVERAMLDMEAGRIAQARGAYADAEESLRAASREFDALESKVQAAICQRLLASLACARGRYDQAEAMLERAREEFVNRNAMLELDELYDSLGELRLRQRRLDDAEVALKESLRLGRRMGWRHGKGRSLLLLAEVSLSRRDIAKARKNATDARENYAGAKDEIGLSEAHTVLGDCAVADEDYPAAIQEYKEARRIDMRLGNERGLAQCYRKLGQVYRLQHEWIRAEESLEQAQEHLDNAQDPRENALYHLELGSLQACLSEHASAIHHFRRAVKSFETLGDQNDLHAAYQRLAASYQAQGRLSEALSCVRDMEQEHGDLWSLMIRDLHPVVADAAEPEFLDGHYSAAVIHAYTALEERIRTLAAGTGEIAKYVPTKKVITDWLSPDSKDAPRFETTGETNDWREFVSASFALVRNPLAHKSVDMSSQEAFVALCIADFMARGVL